MGTFEGESVPVDVTKTGDVIWHSSKPDIATMSTKQGEEGLFSPVTTPKITLGTTDIQATSAVPAAPADIKSNIAHLCVECWEYTHLRQNAKSRFPNDCWWSDDPYARNWEAVYKTDKNGNVMLDKKTKQPIFLYWKDLGPRIVGDPRTVGHTIGDVGCHLTCAAMVLTSTTKNLVDPRLLNNWLNGNNGYTEGTDGNGPKWQIIKDNYPDSNIIDFTDEKAIQTKTRTIAMSYSEIDKALDNCNMVVLTVSGNDGHFPHHYVLVIKGKAGDYTIYDPWIRSSDKLIQPDNISTHYTVKYYNIITVK